MTEKITRERIEGFIRTLESGQDPFASGEIDVHYICILALQAEAMQPRPIEEAKGDDYWKALAFATGSWRVAIWNPNTKKFDDDAYGYELQATDFIPLTSLPEPRR